MALDKPQVAQMLRWGPGNVKRGSFFDDPEIDPREYRKVRAGRAIVEPFYPMRHFPDQQSAENQAQSPGQQ